MVKAIVVDDEPLALHHLAEEIERLSQLEVIGKYRNPKVAIEAIYREHPEVVFLDIEMPEMSGITMAEQIAERLPDVKIVFVTVHDEFAIRAFEISVLDYVLKPLREERLIKTLERLQQSVLTKKSTKPLQATIMIHCFRCLQFEKVGKLPATVRWKTVKSHELFCYLLYKRGQPVRKTSLLEDLWPEIDWQRGVTQLYTAIYQIRKVLREEEIPIELKNVEEGYLLELNGSTIDTREWEDALNNLPQVTSETLEQHIRVFSIYRGDYLGDYEYMWAEGEKKRLQEKWVQHADTIVSYYIATKREREAVSLLLRVQQVLPREENLYFKLMECYDLLGDRYSVEKQYEQLVEMLDTELNLEPHRHVKQWFQAWRRKGFETHKDKEWFAERP